MTGSTWLKFSLAILTWAPSVLERPAAIASSQVGTGRLVLLLLFPFLSLISFPFVVSR